jgi:hypothetical protein
MGLGPYTSFKGTTPMTHLLQLDHTYYHWPIMPSNCEPTGRLIHSWRQSLHSSITFQGLDPSAEDQICNKWAFCGDTWGVQTITRFICFLVVWLQ